MPIPMLFMPLALEGATKRLNKVNARRVIKVEVFMVMVGCCLNETFHKSKQKRNGSASVRSNTDDNNQLTTKIKKAGGL
jgi:hypothetical protein